MTQTPMDTPDHHRARVRMRRRRRDRQILVFGLLIIGITVLGIYFAGVYRGDVVGPFSAPFVTPPSEIETTINIACPPSDSKSLNSTEVSLRVLNGTDRGGLAGTTADDLAGRGFVVLEAANWSRDYEGTVRIIYGQDALARAYSLSNSFNDFELILDTRDSTVVDLVLGENYDPGETLRPQDAPELDSGLPFVRPQECIPVELVAPEPAPRNIPDDPLTAVSPEPSASPSTSPSAEATDGE